MQLNDLWTAVSLGAGIASVVVCLITIWLAVQFYGKAAAADKGLSNALIQLRVETDLLQKVSGRHLAGLLGYGAAPRSSQERLLQLLERAVTPSASMVIPAHVLNGDQTREELVAQSVSSCVAAHHFLALCNVLAQLLLLNAGADELRPAASRILDLSYRNFCHFDDILARVDDARIKANSYQGTYQLTCEMFKPRVVSASTPGNV